MISQCTHSNLFLVQKAKILFHITQSIHRSLFKLSQQNKKMSKMNRMMMFLILMMTLLMMMIKVLKKMLQERMMQIQLMKMTKRMRL